MKLTFKSGWPSTPTRAGGAVGRGKQDKGEQGGGGARVEMTPTRTNCLKLSLTPFCREK